MRNTKLYYVFLSHLSKDKIDVGEIKSSLQRLNIECFVAHEDIEPCSEWQNEIERALYEMDAFVALMTSGFHESKWTDQEVGFAIARKVPILAINLGEPPYGFIAKYQAARTNWKDAPLLIAKTFINDEKAIGGLTEAMRSCKNFAQGHVLAGIFSNIKTLTPEQSFQVIDAYNENNQLAPAFSGESFDLVPFLNKLGYNRYQYGNFRKIERLPDRDPALSATFPT